MVPIQHIVRALDMSDIQHIMTKANAATKILHGYFDLDRTEFVTKSELIKRFSEPTDYYISSHAFDEEFNVHQVLWVYSKKHFLADEGIDEARRMAFTMVPRYT